MFARQMGKNETSAQLEAFLLSHFGARGGTIVKAAPTFRPQTMNSILRLKEVLSSSPLTAKRWQPQFGYMMRVDQASIAFYSADRNAHVVGATASLLLEIDEAQAVDAEKYDRDFRPMASSTNATTVLYGTAWSDDSILEKQKRLNLEHEEVTGQRLHFEYDWTHLAAVNPQYRSFVEAEIARLGKEHPTIRTQYMLKTLPDVGRLFSEEERAKLRGLHDRVREPRPGGIYVAGIDLAGEDEQAEDALLRGLAPRRDSTVVTIAEVSRDANDRPVARVVEHLWWTGRDQVWQYQRLADLWHKWGFVRVSVDASGIGAGIASFLANRFGERAEKFVFSAPSKSGLGFEVLSMINTLCLSLYRDDGSAEWEECWREIRDCRYKLRDNEQMAWSVPEAQGHDDFVVSLALCAHAAGSMAVSPVSALIRAQPEPDTRW